MLILFTTVQHNITKSCTMRGAGPISFSQNPGIKNRREQGEILASVFVIPWLQLARAEVV